MSARIDKSWLVYASIENSEANRCVDLFRRPDGSFGFEEFRRDPEDRGVWTPVQFYSGIAFPSKQTALAEAEKNVPWLTERIKPAQRAAFET